MKEYEVKLDIFFVDTHHVEANSEEEAIKKALQDFDLVLNPKSDNEVYFLEEWEVYNKLAEGNFWHGLIYEASAEEI